MYKILSVVLLIVLSIVVLSGCFDKEEEIKKLSGEVISDYSEEQKEITPIYKEFDFDYDFEKAYESIKDLTGITSNNKLSKDEVENAYGLSELEGTTYDIRKNSEYEIAIIKLKDTNQSTKAFEKVSARIQSLNVSDEKTSIQQNQGIITIVIGNDASTINGKLTKQFEEV